MIRSKHVHPRVSSRVYRILRWVVHLMSVLVVLSLIAVLYLHLRGVPKPILRMIVGKINEMGVPLDVDSIHLSLQGWRGENVRLLRGDPEERSTWLAAHEVFLRRHADPGRVTADGTCYDLVLHDLKSSAPQAWFPGLPEENEFELVEELRVSVCLTPDRVRIRNGYTRWQDIRFNVEGEIRRLPPKPSPELEPGQLDAAMMMAAQLYQEVDQAIRGLALAEPATATIDFMIDPSDPTVNRCRVLLDAGAFRYRNVPFNRFVLSTEYRYPEIVLEEMELVKSDEALDVKGSYNLGSDEMQISITNAITSKEVYRLLPDTVLDTLSLVSVSSDNFPRFSLTFGPSSPAYLLQHIDGSFSIDRMMVGDLEIIGMDGRLSRMGSRLNIHDLNGEVQGQENRSAETGSSMRGGTASGEVFWDSAAHRFGVLAEGSFDPNLLISPLSPVRVATNVIDRFKFDDLPPKARLELGANYDDWNSFFLSLSAKASDMRFHEVPFSSVNASAHYENGILTVNPVDAEQGNDYLKGWLSLNFREDEAAFDASGSINPRSIEQMVYPGSRIFSRYVKVQGPAKVEGRGRLNWEDMRTTAFSANVEAPRVELPMTALDRFSAVVTGLGPEIKIEDALFDLCGGDGTGSMAIVMDPSLEGIPYTIEVKANNVELHQVLSYVSQNIKSSATGNITGQLQLEADFTRDFYRVANGRGRLAIRNGQLADLPLFGGLSSIVRLMLPSFKVFSINSFEGDFDLKDGVIHSDNAYFDGDIISAKGQGSYSHFDGFDAYVQVQVLSENALSRIVRFFTDPILRLFEIKLEGSLRDPKWKLNNLPDINVPENR